MKREDKYQIIESLTETLKGGDIVYLTDTSELDVETINRLRRLCFRRNVKLQVVKNTLLRKAMEASEKNFEPLFDVLKGATSIMMSDTGNVPARLIKEFRKTSPKPILKGAYVQEAIFIGEDQLEILVNLKSKEELIGDLIGLLQSPARNVISALQSGGSTIAGVLKTLSEKES
ncbi:MAG: 50S ribosomal protein L10 [Bacteroidales bacterium]|jgi:large subunit ribosomal protein L10|nr:50S ribosomal protein L10 [Bacteroidales bacterium]NLM92444.1 50S ribosomal protein L10 [Bacteroidales bacterium]